MKYKQDFVEYVNGIIESLEPIHYDDFNRKFNFKEGIDITNMNCVITSDDKMSTISLIVSMIERLTNERYAFKIDEDTKIITGIQKFHKNN